eukprot:1160232-Pelagomonas_calceolata.AAC.6
MACSLQDSASYPQQNQHAARTLTRSPLRGLLAVAHLLLLCNTEHNAKEQEIVHRGKLATLSPSMVQSTQRLLGVLCVHRPGGEQLFTQHRQGLALPQRRQGDTSLHAG